MKSFRNLVEAKMSRQHFQLIADVIAGLDISTTIKKTIAEKFSFEKRLMVKELQKFGIQSILTPPEQLTINTINKYLEIKARGLL